MSFSIRVCALVMAFSPCRSRKRPYHGLGAHLRWPFPPACRGKGDHGNMACACDSLSPLPVEETAIMGTWRALASPFSPCLSRKRPSWGACDPLFPLPVEEKGSIGPSRARQCPRMTPPEHTKSPDCLFPLPVEGKAIPSHEALQSPAEPFRALRSSVRTPATEPCRAPCAPQPRSPAESRGSPFLRQAKGKANRRHPTTAFSLSGRGKSVSQAHGVFP